MLGGGSLLSAPLFVTMISGLMSAAFFNELIFVHEGYLLSATPA